LQKTLPKTTNKTDVDHKLERNVSTAPYTLEQNIEEGSRQLLTFSLNDQDFGIDILRVQEIRNFTRVTPIPNMPESVRGVMNLRGTVIPIVDLRCRFAMPTADYTQFTVIIVVNVGTKVMGLVVDAVSDVLDVGADSIEPPPSMNGIDTAFITGLAKAGDRLVTVLNIDELLGDK
jgi:purine-binding chemotaxis protein CheW